MRASHASYRRAVRSRSHLCHNASNSQRPFAHAAKTRSVSVFVARKTAMIAALVAVLIASTDGTMSRARGVALLAVDPVFIVADVLA